jgi:anti-sigma-K factor RskA
MSASDHSRFSDDVGAYLLAALEPAEQREFELHLETCDECRIAVEELRVAVDALPLTVDEVDTPPTLKASLMATVAAEARERSRPAPRPASPRASRWRERLFARPALAGTFAAVLVAIAIGAGALLGTLGGGGGDHQRVVAAQVDHSRLPAGSAELTVPSDAAQHGGAILHVQGMQRPPAGHVYQVWLQRGKRIVPSSLFTVAADGSGVAAIPQRLKGVDRIMVTREPDGGSAKPSERPVVVANVT